MIAARPYFEDSAAMGFQRVDNDVECFEVHQPFDAALTELALVVAFGRADKGLQQDERVFDDVGGVEY